MIEEQMTPAQLVQRFLERRQPRPEFETAFMPASTAVQQKIAECWGEVFKIDNIGINDNFFDFGGDSLHMTQIVARIRDRLYVEISFDEFFAGPTVSELAIVVDSKAPSVETGA